MSDFHFRDGRPISRINPGKADQLLGISAAVVGDEAVGDLGLEIAALEAQHKRFVDRAALGPVMIRVGGRDAVLEFTRAVNGTQMKAAFCAQISRVCPC